MANSLVRLPIPYVGDFNKGRPLFNAKLFIGEPDLDPEIPANQKTVTGRQEDGTLVTMSQPVRTSSGGYPIYNNAPIELLVDGAYSLKVLDKNDNQTYYFANVEDGRPVTFDDKPVLYRDTVAEAEADVDLTAGMYVTTKGYDSPNDGGGAQYVVVAGGTGTDDGGAFIDRTDGSQLMQIFREVVNVRTFGAVNNGSSEDTAAIQAAIDYCQSNSRDLFFPAYTYLIGATSISSGIKIHSDGAILLRPNNFDLNNVGAGTAGQAHFDIVSPNINVEIRGFTFDGNEAGQSADNPSATSIRFIDQSGANTGSSQITVKDCVFKNQTLFALNINGLTSTNEQQTLTVESCTFLDGRYGLGRGDPASTNTLGYTPWYINCTDHASVIVSDCKFIFRKPITTGQYAVCAIRLTLSGAVTNEDGSSALIANNIFYRCGRSDEDYLGNPAGNNGLGCIDFYAYGREVAITNNKFTEITQAAIRGKTNCDTVSISNNVIDTAVSRGISIVPPTANDQIGNISITGNTVKNTNVNGISVIGGNTATPDEVSNVTITGNTVVATANNISETGNIAGIAVRFINTCVISSNVVANSSGGLGGILGRDVNDIIINANTIRDVDNEGIEVSAITSTAQVTSNRIDTAAGPAINFSGTNTGTSISVVGNNAVNVVNYGVLAISPMDNYVVSSNVFTGISGLSRGIYIPNSPIFAMVLGNITNATIPLFNANTTGTVNQAANSF